MYTSDITRSKALNNIPSRKLKEALLAIENEAITAGNTKEVEQVKHVKLIATNRYAESNIPIEYWSLKMERDFKGDQRLLNKYNEYTADLKSAYTTGQSICFAGGHGLGKQLCLDTEIPTPNGFLKLKDLKEGDQLFDEQGNVCNVTKLHPINISPESYQITFDDGTTVDACADHQWLTYTESDRCYGKIPTIKTTKEICKTLKFKKRKFHINNHSIPCTNPVQYNEQKLPIDPYVLGCYIGDPHSNKSLIGFDYLKNKIPDIYLISSYDQRLALLQGLMDTNGICSKYGKIEYSTKLSKTAYQITELVRSLGIKCNLKNKKCNDTYHVSFTTQLPVFKLSDKLVNLRINKIKQHRFIVNINRIKSKPMRCITVDSPSHLFLITRSFIATHNTMTITCILKKASQKGFTCLYTTLSDIVNVLTIGGGDDKYLARRELAMVDFLAIDEFDPRFMPSENAADLYARSLESVFRTRSQNKLPTLMATNSPKPIESFNGSLKNSIDSLIKGYLQIFPVAPGKDFRKERP